jgi:hypothetical protein
MASSSEAGVPDGREEPVDIVGEPVIAWANGPTGLVSRMDLAGIWNESKFGVDG